MGFLPQRRSQWVVLVGGPALSLVSFVLTYWLDPLSFGQRQSLSALPAFLLSIIVLLISHNVMAFRELEQAALHSDRIYEAVKDYLHVTKIGSPEAALQYIVGRLAITQDVRNTSFNLKDEVERADEKLYDTSAYSAFRRAIIDNTSARALRWKDIGDRTALGRLRSLADDTKPSPRHKPRYEYRIIGHREPQINFIMLTYFDGSTEVLFNWDFRNIGQDPVVLLSRDRDIVEMFAVQFEHLWRSASPDHDKTAVRSTSKR